MALDVYYKDKKTPTVPVPNWHAPWQLSSVLSGHYGWVRCIAFDPSNEWFVTGSADRTIKVLMSVYICLLSTKIEIDR